jgi:hypothetical protein
VGLCIDAYRGIGFDGLMRSDHVPTLHGEVGAQAGYGVLGRLYAVGYIRGLIEGTAERREAALHRRDHSEQHISAAPTTLMHGSARPSGCDPSGKYASAAGRAVVCFWERSAPPLRHLAEEEQQREHAMGTSATEDATPASDA